MRNIAAVLCLMIAAADPFRAEAADADTIAAINASSDALDKAFGDRDIETIRALMTPDHVTVTPYYDGPQSVNDQIASLPDLDYGATRAK